MAVDRSVPSGVAGIRADFAHFCAVHGAQAPAARLRVLLLSRALWGLAIYRFGRWVYERPRSIVYRALYTALFEVGRFVTKTSLSVRSRIEENVWIAPQGSVFVSLGSRVGKGSMLFGENTLGVGGRAGSRGHPQVGERVILCPGASAVGPLQIPDGSVVGANSLVGRTLPDAGAWLGVPPRKVAQVSVPLPRQFGSEEPSMPSEPFWPSFTADLDRHLVYHPGAGKLRKLRLALTTDGVWAMFVYRFGRSLSARSGPAYWLYSLLEIALGVVTSISIDLDAVIAPGFYVGHFVSVRIGRGVRIGANSSVSQMCTIEGNATLGERVYLGSGARVIGPVRVGDGAAICANSVVVSDVPENGVVLGNPGVVISRRGSRDFIYLGEGTGVVDHLAPSTERGAA